jgi:type IV secretion system protein VirB8
MAQWRVETDQRSSYKICGEQLMADKDKYFAQAINWDESQRQADQKSAIRNKKIAWACGTLAGLSIISNIFLVPLKQFVPMVIQVDKFSGSYTVNSPGERFNMGEKRNEQVMIGDLGRYIRAREGFTRGEAETNYKTV